MRQNMVRYFSVAMFGTLVFIWTAGVGAQAADNRAIDKVAPKIVPVGKFTLRFEPGECVVGGKTVHVRKPVLLELTPNKVEQVRGEKHKLASVKPQGWRDGTRLRRVIGAGITLPGCMTPGSVVVRSVSGDTTYEKGKDYLVDETWGMLGRVAGGRIAADEVVAIDYKFSTCRLDTIQVAANGTVSLRKGGEATTCPHPAGADEGCLALANVFVRYNAAELKAGDIFPIGPALPAPTAQESAKKASRVAKARAKLQAGEKLLVGFWGDSVTCGGDASRVETRFPDATIIALRKKYPRAKIEFFNAGIGGSNSMGRLPNLDKDVLQKKPDLVVIEFVNDMGFSPDIMRKNYYQAIDRIRGIGAEVILITPHFMWPRSMGMKDCRGIDRRLACQTLREIAEEKQVGLADAARVWQHLYKVGIPYTTLLKNGFNHPDDRGHQIFVDELMKFF
ncbi:MAG: SGNH/GDSL hydrolase family protein [Pirellulales bacterium]|nr:SGNH/GDSL hydrolase family protein [Pirellulales bacterium]